MKCDKPIFIIPVVLVSLALPLCAAADILSGAFGHASSMVSSFSLSGMGSAPTFSPSWSPSFGTQPSEPPPPSPVDLAVTKETTKRERHIQKLTHTREAWRVALERLDRGQDWRRDLGYWVEESQAAQLGALMASTSLLISVAGPVSVAVEAHQQNAATLWATALKKRGKIEEINALLYEGKLSARQTAQYQQAVRALHVVYDDLTNAMKAEDKFIAFYKQLDKIGDHVLDTAKWIERVQDARGKERLLLAGKLATDFVVDRLVDAGLLTLIKRGAKEAAYETKLVKFVIDYAYNTARFYNAYDNVHATLDQIDDTRFIAAWMQRRIGETTNQINALKTDVQRLNATRTDKGQAEHVLYDLRQKEQQQAYAAGEWFAQQTGFRAPGEPILPNR